MSRDRSRPAMHAVAAAALIGLTTLPCAAGVTAVPMADRATQRDVMLTILARRALLQDAALAPLNLGVRVRNRVATLWGPVPSAELGFKAELRLRALVELLEVRSELLVVAGNDSASAPVPALPPGFLPPAPPPTLPGLPRDAAMPPPLPPPPAIGAPAPVIDETELPPQRLPQSKQ